MKTYLSIAVSIAASLGISTMATAHPGGGGGHFGGTPHFGGGHFGGGAHFGGTAHFGDGQHDHHSGRDGHRRAFGNGPFYGGWSYWGSDDSTPYYSDSDSTVAAVQKALAREGYYHGPIDGALDLITQDAIARYDRDHRLPVTHAIDQSLLNALGLG
jgi:hypothetical protein